MAGITTAFCTSCKSELFAAGHSFQGTVTPTGNSTSSVNVTSVSSMAGVCVGMSISGTNIPANTTIAAITSSTAFVMSAASTGTITGGTLTISGDTFKMALIQGTPTGTYGAATTNYTDVTGNSDEVVGTGYTITGNALTNVSPTTGGTTAWINWSPNPTWTSSTFSTSGCLIYNSSVRLGGTSGTNTTGGGRALGTFSFGGVQTVTAGTLTIQMPTASASLAVMRLS